MAESTKIEFRYRRIPQFADFVELVEMLFPGNQNQQYAAACIFFELKWADSLLPHMARLEIQYSISRRTLQRTHPLVKRQWDHRKRPVKGVLFGMKFISCDLKPRPKTRPKHAPLVLLWFYAGLPFVS